MYDSSGEEYSTEEIEAKNAKDAYKKAEKMAKDYSIDEVGDEEDNEYISVYSIKPKRKKK